ncbi:hypothetical protein [Haliangium sp.]|uniref:hypothetical protein n=1 Tax=Haliangium sp. TaxID=2663208 RepID=UPI003D0BA526
MARLTTGQKIHRLLTFLLGLRNRHIALTLRGYGFTQAAMEEGWSLLRTATAVRLDDKRPTAVPNEMIRRLDEWENRWFPIAGAVLRRHHPEVHELVFHNLTQTEGNEVVLSVTILLARLDELETVADPALASLAAHGLTPAVLAEARALLEQIAQAPVEDEPADDPEEASARASAEDEMWAYYLQWSQISRSVIRNRRWLRELGFLKRSRPGEEPGEDDGEDEDDGLDDDLGEGLDGGLDDDVALATTTDASDDANN